MFLSKADGYNAAHDGCNGGFTGGSEGVVSGLSCLIRGFDGAILSSKSRDALWARFYTGAPRRQRQSVRCPAGDCAAIAERGAIQHSQASLRSLAKRYGVNQKTVAKWRHRAGVADLPTGPREPKSTKLTPEEEAVIVAIRRHTLLALGDCLYALQPTQDAAAWDQSAPDVDGDLPAKKTFKACPIGFFHIRCPAVVCSQTTSGDITEVQTAEGRLYLFVAIDRTRKFAFVELHRTALRKTAAEFLRHLVEAVPYKINIVLPPLGV